MRCDIFISYRRQESKDDINYVGTKEARIIFQYLEKKNYRNVFFDHSKLDVHNFENKILAVIPKASVFIFVLTPKSLLRCVNEGDWVRRELLAAKQAEENGLKIIFIKPCVQDIEYPDSFPEELRFVKQYNHQAIHTSDNSFEGSMDRLIDKYIEPVLHPSIWGKLLKFFKRRKYLILIALLISLLGIGIWCRYGVAIKGDSLENLTIWDYHKNGHYDSLFNFTLDTTLIKNDDFKNLCESAKNGVRESQCELGNILYESEKYFHARFWLMKAAVRGSCEAANGIGRIYYHGKGVTQSYSAARKWFEMAVEMNNYYGKALNNVGLTYLKESRDKKALQYFEKAVNLESRDALTNYGELLFFGSGDHVLHWWSRVKPDTLGLEYLRSAANFGSVRAQITLGNVYSEGLETVLMNPQKGIEYYQIAIRNPDITDEDSSYVANKLEQLGSNLNHGMSY